MKSGEKTKEQRIANRYFLIDSLDNIIRESVYYRSHSHLINPERKVASLNIYSKEIKAKI
jgi:hypothetical protein